MTDQWYATPKQLANATATIHSEEDCCALGHASQTVAVDREDFTDAAVCDACRRRDANTPQCNGYHQRLDEMDAEELIADD
jgi:hypothetical protein